MKINLKGNNGGVKMTNSYFKIFKKAYNKNELFELFSKNKKYMYDNKGNLILAPDTKLQPDEDLTVNYNSLIMSGAVYYYFELSDEERHEFKRRFCDAIIKMIETNSIPLLYDATQIYYILVSQEENDDYFPLKGYSSVFRDMLSKKVKTLSNELKNYIIGPKDCRISGYDRIIEKENKIIDIEKYGIVKSK